MTDKMVKKLDTRMSLWVLVAIGIAKQIEYTITDIVARWVSFHIYGADLTVWALYGILWMSALALIITFKTFGKDDYETKD